jgi:preprotein translocase subunit SecB
MAENEQKVADKQLVIQKIYVKDFSFESPHTPQVFTKSDWSPKTDLNLRSSHSAGADDNHEVVLTISIEAKEGEQTLFLVELHQAGLFHITGYSDDEFKALVGSFCPNILYPYARESIASMISKGGFPEFVLQPINFDALYAQGMAQAKARVEAETKDTETGGVAH